VELKRPEIPVISNVDAAAHSDPAEIRDLLIRQVVSPVWWEDAVRQLIADDYSQIHEVGPGRVLRGLLKRIDSAISCQRVME
jgi:[acyl-carrier-protein] S-malonyltransferase